MKGFFVKYTVYIVLLLTMTVASSTAQWSMVDPRRVSAFDMVSPHHGLVAFNSAGYLLSLYDADTLGGIYTASGIINSIVTVDSSTAYFSVVGDGLYKLSKNWTDISSIGSFNDCSVIAATEHALFFNKGYTLFYSFDGGNTYQSTQGINAFDSVTAIAIYSDETLVASTLNGLYRSTNGGVNWTSLPLAIVGVNTLYVDHAGGAIYLSGPMLMRSLDSGMHWEQVTNVLFTLNGPIFGVNDCSGTFYLGSDGKFRGDLLRTTTRGKFFQDVGPANFSSIVFRHAVAFDRGSTVFWLDTGGLLSVNRNGVDGGIPDTVHDLLALASDSTIHNSLCAGVGGSSSAFTATYQSCTGLILDSLVAIKPNPAFSVTFHPQTVASGAVSIPFTFRAKHGGPDSVRYRVVFHSPVTGVVESDTVMLKGFGDTTGAILDLHVTSLEFGTIGVDSVGKRSFSFFNEGCENLEIDSVVSSNELVFKTSSLALPRALQPGDSFKVTVVFHPVASGEFLEAVTVTTAIGTRFIMLHGIAESGAKGDTTDAVRETASPAVTYFPDPAFDILHIDGTSIGSYTDAVDALGRTFRLAVTPIGGASYSIDVHPLQEGVYQLLLGDGATIRFVKR